MQIFEPHVSFAVRQTHARVSLRFLGMDGEGRQRRAASGKEDQPFLRLIEIGLDTDPSFAGPDFQQGGHVGASRADSPTATRSLSQTSR